MSEEYLLERTISTTSNFRGEFQEYNLKINKNGNIFLKMRTGISCNGHSTTYHSPIIFENIDNIPITLDDKKLIEETFNMHYYLPNATCLINIIKIIKNNNQIKENYLQKNITLQQKNDTLIQANITLQEENDKLNKLNSSIIQYFT